jgi:hypothetical protein
MKYINYHRGSIRWFFVSVVTLIWAAEGISQPVNIQAELSVSGVQPNQEITVTLSISEPADLYYYSTEVEFDAQRFQFLSVINTGFLSDGIQVDGEISSGRIGVSVSRTDGSAIEESGEFMELVFRSNSLAAAGTSEFQFLNNELYNSEGELVEAEHPEAVEIEILEGVGFLELTIPETITVTEGDPYLASGRVYASGITDDEEHAERLTVWVGLNTNNTDPSGWDESAWIEMELSDMDDPYYLYTGEIALFRDVGIYFVALRTQLDDDEFAFGGRNGFWDIADSPSAQLEIVEAPAFRYTIAHWDFQYDLVHPALSVPNNDFAEVKLHGIGLSTSETNTQGSITYLNTTNWHEQEEFDEKYIQISVSTEQFENIELNSSHTGTGAGPRYFQVQVSHDGLNWDDLNEGAIDLADGTVHLQSIPIPSDYYHQESVYIRWLRGEDERISPNTNTTIGPTGTHRIGNITISGTNIDPQRVDVLPGDTNNDGVVNAMDILPLGTYWLSRGPQPVYDFVTFEPREVEEWIPGSATFADANGDGVVDHRDLLPIGLNFGQEWPDAPALVMQPEPLAQLNLPALKSGEEIEIELRSNQPEILKGLAFRFTLDGISPQSWSVVSDDLPEWAVPWSEENRLLDFNQKQQSAFEAAYTYLGRNRGLEIQDMLILRIRANMDWPGPAFASLKWMAASRPDGEVDQLTDITMISSDHSGGLSELPSVTRLHQNFPNPFNPTTMIRYELSGANEVRLDVFNVIGQHVATLVESRQEAGSYTFNFDGSNLASGLYLYRLQAGETVQTKRMMLVK